jgi:hypothetical protein
MNQRTLASAEFGVFMPHDTNPQQIDEQPDQLRQFDTG